MNPKEVWRPYARLFQGTADGGPLTIGEKLQLAMQMHLPKDQPAAVAAFMDRMRGHFKEHWDVELPELALSAPTEGGVKREEEGEEQAEQPLLDKDQAPAAAAVPVGGTIIAPSCGEAGASASAPLGDDIQYAGVERMAVDDSSPDGVKTEQMDPNNRAGEDQAQQAQQGCKDKGEGAPLLDAKEASPAPAPVLDTAAS